MAAQEDEIKSLKEKNNELVQKVQYWKMTAAQRENEKLELMKEINELRLKVIRLKSGGAAEARKLDAALQAASEQALSHLVQASSAVARTVELAKTYMRDREGLEIASPRWSTISNSNEKVHRVPPMMIGGQSIQPVVSLSRATFNLNGSRQASRSPNSTGNVTVRALPMHMLQDVYIPLTRIDMRPIQSNAEIEPEPANDSAENIPFDTSMEETPEEPENMTDDDDYDSSRRLDVVAEDAEPETEEMTPPRVLGDNPLEGPSWLLEARVAGAAGVEGAAGAEGAGGTPAAPGPSFEPDSTTEGGDTPTRGSPETAAGAEPARMFTPTVRRKRAAEPLTEATHADVNGMEALQSSRVLQVLVPKMRLGESPLGESLLGESPPKRRAAPRFDAPSPNGATDSRVIVSEELETQAKDRRSIQPNLTVTNNRRDNGDSVENTERRGNCSQRANGNQESIGNCSRRDNGNTERNGNCSRKDNGNTERNDKYSQRESGNNRERHGNSQRDNRNSETHDNCSQRDSGDSDSGSGADRVGEGRTRRNRKPVTYKEKPLNRKLRR